MPKAPVTLRDIAKKVGVHTSTVSRVLNSDSDSKISHDVIQKIQKAADELGYNRNPFARSLKMNRSMTIGVLIPDLTDPLFPPAIRGIDTALAEAGYSAVLANSDNDPTSERRIFETMKARKVDGFIMATSPRSGEVVEECLQAGIPLVLMNRLSDNHSVPSVVHDNEMGARLAVDHLFNLGHRRIGHLAGPSTMSTGHLRQVGFLAAMRAHNLEVQDGDIVQADKFTEESGRVASSGLLDPARGLTAIVAGGDMLALGCYDAMNELNIRCPSQVSVTGFNDIQFAGKFSPPLTSVHVDKFLTGLESARLILRVIKGDLVSGMSLVMRPRLVVRQSAAAPGKR